MDGDKKNVDVQYIQCTLKSCGKWRTIPKNILDQEYTNNPKQRFVCSQNYWNSAYNSCEAPEDSAIDENIDDESRSGNDRADYEENPLDSFFPFDPCCLRRTAKYIDPLYRGWSDIDNKSVPINDDANDDTAMKAIPIPSPKRERLKSYDPFSWESPFSAAGHGNLPNENDHENDFHDDIYSGVSISPNTDMLRKSRLEKLHENGGVAMRKRAISQVSSHGSW